MILAVNPLPSPDSESSVVPYSPLESTPVLETDWRRARRGGLDQTTTSLIPSRSSRDDTGSKLPLKDAVVSFLAPSPVL